MVPLPRRSDRTPVARWPPWSPRRGRAGTRRSRPGPARGRRSRPGSSGRRWRSWSRPGSGAGAEVADAEEGAAGSPAVPPGPCLVVRVRGRHQQVDVAGAGRPLEELVAGEVVLCLLGDERGERPGRQVGVRFEGVPQAPGAAEAEQEAGVRLLGELPAGTVRQSGTGGQVPQVPSDAGAGGVELGRHVGRGRGVQGPGGDGPHTGHATGGGAGGGEEQPPGYGPRGLFRPCGPVGCAGRGTGFPVVGPVAGGGAGSVRRPAGRPGPGARTRRRSRPGR
ncbi:hypothetical protein ADK60_33095 [Streptomyces sp. XY431]|nr:hypothetical protein ADK60_33095 [Streptomyces sp. XY431]